MDDGLPQTDMERLVFFEAMRERCAAEYLRSPHDPENLTNWGNALLELAHFQQGDESVPLVEDSISKLEAALKINPKKHQTLWILGNAHTCHGFLVADVLEASEHFKKAATCFQDAYNEEPSEVYSKSLEMARQAPLLHQELQVQLASQGMAINASSSSSRSGNKGKKKKSSKRSDLAYDVLGWVVLAIGIVAWVGMANMAKAAPSAK
ncbi:hypothetical protein SELMODRAFT_437971 [Selaginella moellendorffii]|uniref:Mitochondrial import receptor subunit TOM20 n=1 Tax=Selaginella moellendorffii TaxID=88036 RepID=D8QSG7_SELML|nr:probable mitochondrial import receptor subunit TOM20 [Selaginella moellendorffii]XP_002964749.1 probable mitochondrial import receptor subunit TOM20 [Selaginella moellendorffii]EFJ33587.1 hypothetical protein SELMODRAFT_406219 [Selaginella moellendorffii]EFJ36943.1 hypothetical protein SELMODRAFT_437971 [Selaginella moellendorffii]|eukprot:XP_002961683.1 probable mitochondrial import receptor subunit TOM20 [Selaginella moellendorffii]